MKKTNILFWIVTGLFSAFMLWSSIPDIMMHEEAVAFMHDHLGYPVYIIPFIGVAKLLGIITILLPGIPRVKEWAYSGLGIDLIGAVYSAIAVDGFHPSMLIMVLPLGFLVWSYILHHRRRNFAVSGRSVNV